MENGISVIVPVYNVRQYLPQCIESIQRNTFREIELILVDDGSTDGSGDVCEAYAREDNRIRVFHQKNKGPIAARRKGVEASRYAYVTFADADDFIAPVSYALAAPLMQNGVDIVIFGIIRYTDETAQKKEACIFSEGVYGEKEIAERIWPVMIWDSGTGRCGIDPALWNKIVKRELAVLAYQTLTEDGFHYGEDVAVVYPMLKAARTIAIKDAAWYFHRQRTGGAVAGYLAEEAYFDKLYLLYRHLMRVLGDDLQMARQIEAFYMHSVALRRRVFGDVTEQIRHLFPFDRVEKGERIVLYGAGVVGRSYMEQLRKTSYCRVALWVDQNYEKLRPRLPVSSIAEICSASYDRIVIAIENEQVRAAVTARLAQMGVCAAQIV